MATILIVDDLASNRRSLAELLGGAHKIIEATNGSTGLAAARAETPDLVITDVLMPVLDGYEFARQLHLDAATSAIPVLFYTAAYGEREARELAKASGVRHVLTKPPQPENVLAVIARVLSAGGGDITTESAEAATVHREQLELLGDQLSKTAEDLRLANTRLRGLINIALDFASQGDSEARLQRLCHAIHDLFSAGYATIGLVDRHSRLVTSMVSSGVDGKPWIRGGDVLTGIFATVVDEHRATRGKVSNESVEAHSFPAGHPEVEDFLIAPITSPTDACGWICLVCNEGTAFTAEEENQLLALAGNVGRIYELEHEIADRLLAERALRDSERLTRNLLEHLPHRILVKDRESKVRFCNANYASDLGLTADEVIGKNANAFYPAALAEAYEANDREVMDSGVLQNIEEPYEVNGTKRWARTIKVPYRDEQNQITGVLAVFEDITERRMMEQQFQQAQKMEAVGQLAGGIAHDFNNLLTAILGYCELLLEDVAPDEHEGHDIRQIQKAGMRAAELTRQLLAFSRKEIIAPTVLDLNAMIIDMRPMLDRLIREDVKILLSLAPRLAPVTADRGQVEQIVLNLAVNARDAMPTGGRLTIETGNVDLDDYYVRLHPSVKAGPYVCMTVTDTGQGMTAEVKERLFEPFFTTKSRGRGTGLGLASVQGTMARNGGSVSVYSELGQGSAFKVYFPRTDAEAAVAIGQPVAIAPKLAGTETVLLVEDADELRGLISVMLKRQGYTVLVAANADDARRLCAEHPNVDLLLTDVVMPGASGPELSKELVANRPDLKVIYMSGYTDDAIVDRGVLLPGIAFLPKPFTAESLGRKIRSVLDV